MAQVHARPVPGERPAPHGAVLRGPALGPPQLRARGGDRPARRRALARHALRDGVRPGVPREHPRLPARAGERPDGARRLDLDQAARVAQDRPRRARRRHPAARGRRLVRPARDARQFAPRRRRPHRGGAPRTCAGRQRARRRGAREPRAAAVHGRRSASSFSASSCACPPCRPGGAATPTAGTPCSTGSARTRTTSSCAASTSRASASAGAQPRRAAPPDPRRAAPLRRPGPAAPLAGAGVVERGTSGCPPRRACAPSRSATARRSARSSAGSRPSWRRRARPITKDVWVRQGRCRRIPTRASSTSRRWTSGRASRRSPRARSRTCSGPAATPSAPRTCCGSCSPPTRTSKSSRRPSTRSTPSRRGRCSAPCGASPGRRFDDPEAEFRSLLLDAPRPGSAAYALERLRDALEGVRDQLSNDTWRVFSHTDRAKKALHTSERSHRITESAGRMLTAVLSLQGVTASMIRDPGWHMIEAGPLPRARAAGLRCCCGATTTERLGIAADRDVLEGVLVAAESSVTFRRRYRGNVRTSGRARAAPASTATTPGRSPSPSASCARTSPRCPPRRDRRAPSACSSTSRPRSRTSTSRRWRRRPAPRRPRLQRFFETRPARSSSSSSDAIADVHFASGPPPQMLSTLSLIELPGAECT